MPYPSKLLNDNETVAVDLHPHWWFFSEPMGALLGSIVLAIVVFVATDGDAQKWLSFIALALIVITAIWLVIRYAKWATTHFVVTSERVIFRNGIVAKSGIEIPIGRVNSVNSGQTVFERMVGAGDLMIESGAEDGQQRFTDIRSPSRVQNMIQEQITAYRRGGANEDSGSSQRPVDAASQLEKLEGMLQRGSLTQEEFDAQKRRLLG